MCFIAQIDRAPKVAHKDIECYKVVHKSGKSLIMDWPWKSGEENPHVRIMPIYKELEGTLWIEAGYHAYTTRSEASLELAYRNANRRFEKKNYRIITCVIPKGTVYYAKEHNVVAEQMNRV